MHLESHICVIKKNSYKYRIVVVNNTLNVATSSYNIIQWSSETFIPLLVIFKLWNVWFGFFDTLIVFLLYFSYIVLLYFITAKIDLVIQCLWII